MSLFCNSCNAQIISAQVTLSWNTMLHFPSSRSLAPFKSLNTGLLGQRGIHKESKRGTQWSFVGGSRIAILPEVARSSRRGKGSSVSACWLTTSQIATNAFTLGTVAVLPFYTLMIAAPNAPITKRTMESNVPYIALGILYAYILYLSWSPETLRVMFASNYWLPELPGITRMFSNETTVSSAWIHLLAVDLFAARQVFRDGIENKIETRHSISLCLLFCPIGIATHAITKQLTRAKHGPSH